MDWDNGDNYGHMDNGWGIVMLLGMLGTWVLIAIAVVWIVRMTQATHPPSSPHQSAANAEQILAERLARGEIDADEYKSRMTALNSSR